MKGRADVPDALLFVDDDSLARARRERNDWQRFKHGLCVVEAKRWDRLLDRVEKGKEADEGVPSTQMLRYLRRADDVTEGGLRWGVLTNGRIWRLYWQGALSVAEDFLEMQRRGVSAAHSLDLADSLLRRKNSLLACAGNIGAAPWNPSAFEGAFRSFQPETGEFPALFPAPREFAAARGAQTPSKTAPAATRQPPGWRSENLRVSLKGTGRSGASCSYET